jgi:predicted dehydrogenase
MATNIADAQKMIDAAGKAGKFLMVGHSQRLVEAHIKAKEILDSGALGRVITFKTSLMHKGPESWSAQKGPATWFFKKDESAMGAMGDLGVHKIDLLRWMLDDEIEQVTAHIDTLDKKDGEGNFIGVDDNAICIFRTAKGAVGTLTASWSNYGPEENGTVVYCEKGVLSVCTSQERPLFITMKDGKTEDIEAGTIQTNSNQTKSGVIDMFVDSIQKGVEPEISGEEALAAIKIVAACFESSEKGEKNFSLMSYKVAKRI